MLIHTQALMHHITLCTRLTPIAPVSQTTLYEYLQRVRDNRACLSRYNNGRRQVNHGKTSTDLTLIGLGI